MMGGEGKETHRALCYKQAVQRVHLVPKQSNRAENRTYRDGKLSYIQSYSTAGQTLLFTHPSIHTHTHHYMILW